MPVFFKIIHFKSAAVGVLFFLAVFLMGILWGSVNYNGLADVFSNSIESAR